MQDHPTDVAQLRPWLYTVARHLAIDALRARKARPTEVILTDLSTLAGEPDDIERGDRAHRAAGSVLEPQPPQVLIEVFYRGRTM
jgi:RNA polymerase sigma-70 factor (ECF subfamily)